MKKKNRMYDNIVQEKESYFQQIQFVYSVKIF